VLEEVSAERDHDVTATPASDVSDPVARTAALEALDQTIRLYRETMAFPLDSRPADGANEHITRWNHPISTGQPFATDADGREIQASVSIDRVFAAPGQAVSVRVSVVHVDDGTPAAIRDVRAALHWGDRVRNEWAGAQAIPLRGTNGDWTGSIAPSQLDALRGRVRDLQVVAHVEHGSYQRDLALDLAYAAEQPVVVRGIASEQVVAGSLELGLDAELAAAVPVRLMATLFAGDGKTPIAVYDDRYFPARSGRQVIPVTFFGKILHDRKIDGPYRLGAVHGYAYHQDASPDQRMFDRADLPVMATAAYRSDRFSPDAYRSQEVTDKLARYEALRRSL